MFRSVSVSSQFYQQVEMKVTEGLESIILPCKTKPYLDLHPKSVHVRQDETDDLRGQNQRYSGRTSMRPDALDTGDFSLTLRKPTKTDSSIYTCSISDGREERRLRDIQLQVKGQPQTPCVQVKDPSQILSFNPRN
uniref:Immunoglobulin V-set domain-containing protein n=1 Tax=Maylandia zebra TaxID=106582 RepID=A0A3P9D6A4_9CICH